MKKLLLFILLFGVFSIGYSIDTPTQSSPLNGATDKALKIVFNINQVSGANLYQYMLDTVSTFDSPVLKTFSHSNYYSSISISDLYYETKYFWKIRACNATDTSAWSSVWNFTTIDFGALQQAPNNNDLNINLQVSLDINRITGSKYYDYQLDTVPTFDSPDLQNFTHSDTYSGQTVYNLRYGQKYYWRVRGRNNSDTSIWTNAWNFTTKNYGATQQSPYNNSVNTNLSVSLYINKVTGSKYYDYQLDTVPTFDSPDLQEFTHSNSYSGQTVYDLRYGQKYYWRARGRNDSDTSNWTTTWNFTTTNVGVTQSSPYNDAVNTNVRVTMYINKVTGSEYYDYQLDTVPTFDSPNLQEFTHSDSYSGETVYDLRYGQKYYWRVRGRNDTDTSNWTTTWNFTTTNVGVTQSSPYNDAVNTNVRVTMYINKVIGSEHYDYQLDTAPTFNSPNLQEFTHSDSYSGETVYDLRYGQKYYWRVRGRNDTDTSNWTTTWNFSTNSLGATPQSPYNNSTGVSVNTSLYLNKVTGSDDFDYQLDTSTSFNSGLLQELSHSNSYSGTNISTLRYGTTYYWHVRGRNDNDTSQWSYLYSFKTAFAIASPTLSTPQNDSIDAPFSSITLVWDDLPVADSYQFQVSKNSYFSTILKTGKTSMTFSSVSGLYPATTYYWRVRAENANGYSDWCTEWHFKTKGVALSAPTLVSPDSAATGISTSPTLTWNSVYGANNYTLQVSPTDDFSVNSEFSTSNTDYSISGLADNSDYFWRVKSSDGSTESGWSYIWKFSTGSQTLDAPTLSSPANNSTDIDTTSASLSWNSVATATSYTLEVSTASDFATIFYTVSGANTSADVTNLTCGTLYYWRVSATDGTTTSDWSSVWSFTTKDCSASGLVAPTLVSPTDLSTGISTAPTLDWNDVTGATMYEYQYSTSSSFMTYINDYVGSSQANLTGLNNNYTYYWRVRASDGTDYSDWSDVWSFTTIEAGSGLATPTLISPSNGATDQELVLSLLWNIVPNANNYEYQYSTDSTFTIAEGSTTQSGSISIGTLNYNTKYFWRIKATDGSQFSDWSEVWSFTTKKDTTVAINDLSIDFNIYPNPTTNCISISYTDFSNVDIYNLQGVKILSTDDNVIDVSNFSAGTYLLILSNDNEIIGRKLFIKE